MPGKPRAPKIDPTIQAAETTSRRALITGIVVAVITVMGGLGVAFLNGWFGGQKQSLMVDTSIYRVRVTVLDEQGKPTEDADVTSTFGGEVKKVKSGWQFDIPAASKPKDGKLTLIATKESAFLKGEEAFTLEKEMNPAVIVKMQRTATAKVRGQIVDSKNRGVAGARVFVVGFEDDVVITKEGGNFELPAHAAVGQTVNLHAEKAGFLAVTQEHPAGDHPATLVLEVIR